MLKLVSVLGTTDISKFLPKGPSGHVTGADLHRDELTAPKH